jgi:endonuclease/exonuclease/phosphatase family metal-dependent hydrolase
MKNTKSTIAIVILAAAAILPLAARTTPKKADSPAKPATITFLAANVGNAHPSIATQRSKFKLRETGVKILSRNIKNINPDIIFLEEIDPEGENQPARLLDINNDYIVQCAKDICMAVKKARNKFLFLDGCEDRDGYLFCRTYLKEKYKNIALFAVHTSSPSDDSAFAKREKQISGFLDDIVAWDKTGESLIAGGDFNFDPYRFESFGYNLLNNHDDRHVALTKWNTVFAHPESSRLRIISLNEPTWFITKFLIKHDKFTLDHVITNLESKNCKVLVSDEQRLDVDHTAKKSKTFMDHRAVQCTIEVE